MKLRGKRRGRSTYSPTAGLPFDDSEFESRIAWIWTTARSGSTWLLRMLSHPLKLVDSSQKPTDMLGWVAPATWQGKLDVFPVDTTFVANHLLPLAGSADYSDELVPVTFASALGLRNRANYFFSDKYEDAWRPEVRRMMLVRFHRFLERAAERHETDDPVLLLKEVAGAHAAPLIMSMFPRSRMIFLVRDGRDVVDSQTAANQPGGWLPVKGWTTPSEREEFVRRRAHNWVGDIASIDRAFKAHPAELRTMVRYEDLLAAPAEHLRPLMDFLGLKRGEHWLERSVEVNSFESIAPEQKGPEKFFRSASPGAWRENLTDSEARILEEVMGERLKQLGYGTDQGSGEGHDVEPRENGADGQGSQFPNLLGVPRLSQERDFSNLRNLVTQRGGAASRRERKVALTFDDGPGLQTYRVLETLERYGAKGTFFLVGHKIEGHEDIVRRVLRGGHEVGNHSFDHSPFPSPDDIAACTAVIRHVAGRQPSVFRPPFGSIDAEAAQAAIDAGMRVILWSVDSEDAMPPWVGISPEEITRNVLEGVTPGSIVLLHDCLSWSRAADALPDLIEALTDDGYRLVTVSELLEDRAPANTPAKGPLMRRLAGVRRRVAPRTPGGGRTNGDRPQPVDIRDHLVGVLRDLAGEVEPPPEREAAGTMIREARAGLLEAATGSDVLLGHTVSYDTKAILIVSLGFSLRRAEHEHGNATRLPDELATRLSTADDPGAEAGRIAEELAGPRRYARLVAARMKAQAAVGAGAGPASALPKPADPPVDAPHTATPGFLAIFAPGTDVWQELETWARATGRHLTRTRNQALLDAAGIGDAFDLETAVHRLDVDFLFRFGYALAACDEKISRGDP